VVIDYRGFGTSTGTPSEEGLLVDALASVDWAMKEAGIPSSRIVIWSQSIGTAVATTLIEHMASLPQPVFFSGLVLVAPFADVKTLTSTYRVAGMIPLLEPVARFPRLLDLLNAFIRDKWPSADRLASFVRTCERMRPLPADESDKKAGKYYRINIIHAEDDYDIPWSHSNQMFWSAVNASLSEGITFNDLELEKEAGKVALGAGGWTFSTVMRNGVVREDILKYGLHDWIMGYPIVSVAVMRAFDLDS
jgi:abhydrolase domain-containing protein 12